MTTAFIMAGGDQTRWGADLPPKQLIDVFGEKLILRTIRLLESFHEIYPVIYAKDQRIVDACFGYPVISPEGSLASSVLDSSKYWQGGRICVLLGDVIYSPTLLSLSLGSNTPATFWGSRHEIWALTFNDQSVMQLVLRDVVKDFKNGGTGKLWQVYRRWCGFPLYSHAFDNAGIYQTYLDGFVQDFNFYPQYQDWLEKQKK